MTKDWSFVADKLQGLGVALFDSRKDLCFLRLRFANLFLYLLTFQDWVSACFLEFW